MKALRMKPELAAGGNGGDVTKICCLALLDTSKHFECVIMTSLTHHRCKVLGNCLSL